MQTKDFTDPALAQQFIKELQGNNAVDVVQTIDGSFRISWLANKTFTSFDGKEHIDEVWTKEDGTMIACQDLELEHAKNIIRMILRNQRELAQAQQEMLESLQAAMEQAGSEDVADDFPAWMTDIPETAPTLH